MSESLKAANTLKEELLSLMRQQLFYPRKSLGQNFLIDRKVFDCILGQLSLTKNDALVEVGMGPGLLSRELAEAAGMYLGCEIDQRFMPFHTQLFAGLDANAYFIYEDALKIDFGPYIDKLASYESLLVFSNLPYYITTDLILKMIRDFPQAEQMVFMLEKVALNRLLASPASKAYGSLAIISSLWGEWKALMTVSGRSFDPVPQTTSSLYSLIANKDSPYKDAASSASFHRFTTAVLGNRRKKLANALMYTKIQDEEIVRKGLDIFLEEENLTADVRAESLTARQFVRLYTKFLD